MKMVDIPRQEVAILEGTNDVLEVKRNIICKCGCWMLKDVQVLEFDTVTLLLLKVERNDYCVSS